jgi:kynurenine formamidase
MFDEIIDLTYTMSYNMYHFKGDPPVQISSFHTIQRDGWNVSQITFGSHSGTHIDAPSHIIEGGPTVDEISLDRFFGHAAVLDVSYKKPGEAIKVDDLKIIENFRNFDYVLLYTGMSKYWGDENYLTNFSYLELEVAELLVNLKVKIVGVDWMTVEKFGGDGSVHKKLLSNNIVIVENLINLDKIINEVVLFTCFPLKFDGLDGAQTRAVAFRFKNNIA